MDTARVPTTRFAPAVAGMAAAARLPRARRVMRAVRRSSFNDRELRCLSYPPVQLLGGVS